MSIRNWLAVCFSWVVPVALLSASEASAQPDFADTVIIDEDNGFPGVCAAPCYSVEKSVEVYFAGNPTAPAVCGGGDNTYVYTLSHIGGSIPAPGIPITEFEVTVDFTLVTSAGSIPSAGIAPTSTTVSPLNVVSWAFPLSNLCPACLIEGMTSDPLYICSPALPGSSPDNVSTTAIALDAPGECIVPVESPSACLLLIDEDSIDNGNPPNFFNDTEVNDDIPDLAQRQELRYFDQNEGQTITLHTGEVGDEGWFAPKSFPPSWDAAGPTLDGARNFVGNPGLGPNALPYNVGPGLGSGNDPEVLLDKIPDVTPLRATGLSQLIGQTCCAVVWDSDISINYDPLNGSLKGEKLGTVAFEVLDVRALNGYSSSSLPEVDILIADAETVCELDLIFNTDAPEPDSSSEPFDVDPGGGSGGGGGGGGGSGCDGSVVSITKSKYANSTNRLKVFATHPSSGGASLVVDVDGYVVSEAMTYKASKDRYQLFVEISDNLDGLDVTVSDENGECDIAPIH